MRFFYSIGIYLYTLGIRVAALMGHRNAKLMVAGWKQWKAAVSRLLSDRPTVWFHAASLGEFEQARPVLETYRHRHPDHQVLLTFFSPSGYEVRKNFPAADAVCYLPMDTPRNVRRFVSMVKPVRVFFVKYEFWFNYLGVLKQQHIPTYIFSAIFRPGQYFFKWYGGWFRKQLGRCFAHLFVQNEESRQLLVGAGIGQCTVAGDTRFDRVDEIAATAPRNEVVEAWLAATQGKRPQDGKVIVCGSTWPPDEELLSRFAKMPPRPVRLIIAPHLIDEAHLQTIEKIFPHSVRYSALSSTPLSEVADGQRKVGNVLIIDNIGMLAQLYRYGDMAYIGGGFGVGIHNILEAVTFGKPVVFGPNYHKFQEARDIIQAGGGWSIATADELMHTLGPLVADGEKLQAPAQACRRYVERNLGSTTIILNTVEQ